MSLAERLEKIKSPRLQNQREAAIVLDTIEKTLQDQKQTPTATGYFAALLALLNQTLAPAGGIINKDLATSVVYLLDVVAAHVPAALLRSKATPILTSLEACFAYSGAEGPMLRPAIGCLESFLVAQDADAWALAQTEIGARWAVGRLLRLSLEQRPKIRKRAQEALAHVLQQQPSIPSLDHPAADMCAATALHSLQQIVHETKLKTPKFRAGADDHFPGLIHALQLIKTIAFASGGWPARQLDQLCELVLEIAKSNNEYLTMASFEVFEAVFTGMANEVASAKIPHLLEIIIDLKPSSNDTQLLPPWIAVLSRGYDVSAQMEPEDTFAKLPAIFEMVAELLTSMSHNIRLSASECLVSFCANCIPSHVILQPSVYDEKTLEKIGKIALGLLSLKYQSAWMETFNVFEALFETLKWRATPMLNEVVRVVGELRSSESFAGTNQADKVIGKAVEALGPQELLRILPLNLVNAKKGKVGRAWLLPILRDNIINARIGHFRSTFVPLSESIKSRVPSHGDKTMETKIFETLVAQIWSLLPGYCTLPLDLTESFDTSFAEQLSTILYEQPDMRLDVCKALQLLVESNNEIVNIPTEETDLILQRNVTQATAKQNLEYLGTMASSMLAVLFNVYSGTLPQYRGYILQCINAYLGIIPKPELDGAFTEVVQQLEAELVKEASNKTVTGNKSSASTMPPTSHALLDLIITMAIHIPRTSFPTLWGIARLILPRAADPSLQKKAYKLIPRLEQCELGLEALRQNSADIQSILLDSSSAATAPARRDRLAAFATVVRYIPNDSLHFIAAILSEVVIGAKETNEKARSASFGLLVVMGQRMKNGGSVDRSKIPHMESDAGIVEASLEEYVTMLSAGLAGTTPHMISAGVTALARISYEFHEDLSSESLVSLLEIMQMLLDHNSREIVRAVLGFFKVATVSLPEDLLLPNLPTLVPALTRWSREQKARLRVKVKGILDRLIRRFGFDEIDKHCPEAERKLIVNVRKKRERAKRKKEAAKAGSRAQGDEADGDHGHSRAAQHASEFDRALQDSDDDDESGSEMSFDGAGETIEGDLGRENEDNATSSEEETPTLRNKGRQTYIVEDPEEPLDLLDRRALGHLSSVRPVKIRNTNGQRQHKARMDLDGKLLFGRSKQSLRTKEVDASGAGDAALGDGGGIDAYVEAIKGRDAPQRGRGGKIKFKNRRESAVEDDEMGGVEDEPLQKGKPRIQNGRGSGHVRRNSEGWERKKAKFGAPRRGLESGKGSGARDNGHASRGRGGRPRGTSGRGAIASGRSRGRMR